MTLSDDDGKILINIAKQTISSRFEGKEPDIEDSLKKKYSNKQGGFVTLTIDGELRGCIGFTEPIFQLWECVVHAAGAAAFEDPRFPPLSKEEFKKIKVEVSVLTLPELIKVDDIQEYSKEIEIGKHGLIVEKKGVKGLLLPQVFTEYKVEWEEALDMTCQKAGFNNDAWREKDCKVFKFSAQIFSE